MKHSKPRCRASWLAIVTAVALAPVAGGVGLDAVGSRGSDRPPEPGLAKTAPSRALPGPSGVISGPCSSGATSDWVTAQVRCPEGTCSCPAGGCSANCCPP